MDHRNIWLLISPILKVQEKGWMTSDATQKSSGLPVIFKGHRLGVNRSEGFCMEPWDNGCPGSWGQDSHLAKPYGRDPCPLGPWGHDLCPAELQDHCCPSGSGRQDTWVREDYSQALWSNRIYLARFWTYLRSVTFFFLQSSLWNGNAYPMPVSSWCFGST